MTNKCLGCGEAVDLEYVCDTCYSAYDMQAEFDYRAIMLGDCTFENMLIDIQRAERISVSSLPF